MVQRIRGGAVAARAPAVRPAVQPPGPGQGPHRRQAGRPGRRRRRHRGGRLVDPAAPGRAPSAGPRELTVVTNGQDTFQALQDVPGVTVLLTGGQLDRRTGSLVGPMATRAAARGAAAPAVRVGRRPRSPARHVRGHAGGGRGEAGAGRRGRRGGGGRRLQQARPAGPGAGAAARAGRPPGHRARPDRRPARPLPRAVAASAEPPAPAGERRRRPRGGVRRRPSRRCARSSGSGPSSSIPSPAASPGPRRSPTCGASPGAGCPGACSTTSTAAPRTSAPWPPTARRFARIDVPAPGAARRRRRSTRRRRCSAGRCRSRSCWRRPGSPASPTPQGELAVARAAERAGLPYTLSTLAPARSRRSPRSATAASGSRCTRGATAGWSRRWSTVPPAPATRRSCSPSTPPCSAGASATCAAGFSLPPKIGLGTLLDGAAPPRLDVGVRAQPSRSAFANVVGRDVGDGADAGDARRLHQHASSTRRCRGTTSTGCARCGTARSCSRASRPSTTPCSPPSAGVDAIALSNHGGRQLDARAGADRPRRAGRRRRRRPHRDHLRRRRPAGQRHRQGRRRSAPRPCMAGRAYLYGLGAAGERGVDHVLGAARRRRPPHDGPHRRPHHRRPHPGSRLRAGSLTTPPAVAVSPRAAVTTATVTHRTQRISDGTFPLGRGAADVDHTCPRQVEDRRVAQRCVRLSGSTRSRRRLRRRLAAVATASLRGLRPFPVGAPAAPRVSPCLTCRHVRYRATSSIRRGRRGSCSEAPTG